MNPLFNRVDIFTVVENQKQELKKTFQTVTNTEVDSDPVAVAARLIEQFSINVPVLDEEKKYALTKETQVDVSRDPRRFISDRSRPFYIAGTEVTIVVPFYGDAGVFEVQPTMFTLNPPFGEIHKNELHLVYEITDAGFDVEDAANRTIGQVKQYLQSLHDSAELLKSDLQQLVNSLIQKRKQERGTHSQIIAGLKIPVKQVAPAPPRSVPTSSGAATNRSKVTKKQEDEWDVFISHASEDKEAIARPLADALQSKGLRVWYDDFSLRLGDSLRQSIDRGLGRSRFGVVILSAHFFEKHWPQQELNGLASREVSGERVILPVWHGVGFAEVRNYSVTLADRLAVQTKDGLEHVVEKIMEVVK
jgi:TIR domain